MPIEINKTTQNTCTLCEYALRCTSYSTRDSVCNSKGPYGSCDQYKNYQRREKSEAEIRQRGLVKKLVA